MLISYVKKSYAFIKALTRGAEKSAIILSYLLGQRRIPIMKTKKTKAVRRLISILLSIALLCASSALTLCSVAAAETADDENEPQYKYYNLSDGSIALREYLGEETNVVVPDKLIVEENGQKVTKKVTKLELTFNYSKIVESVVVPKSVTVIDRAFSHCSKLKSIVIKGATKYADKPFDDLPSLETVILESNKSLTVDMKRDFPIFRNCKNLKTVTFPHGVSELKNVFTDCPSLTSIYLPTTVKNIYGNFIDNPLSWKEDSVTFYSYPSEYIEYWCKNKGFNFVNLESLYKPKKSNKSLQAGATFNSAMPGVDNIVSEYSSDNTKIAKIDKSGKVTALNKGTAAVTTTVHPIGFNLKSYAKAYSYKVKVTTEPKISKTSVTVKKGKEVTVKLTGKAKAIDNKYTNTKLAKITSKTNATSLKIKGLKKGKTTIKVKVNGVKTLSVKVNVL